MPLSQKFGLHQAEEPRSQLTTTAVTPRRAPTTRQQPSPGETQRSSTTRRGARTVTQATETTPRELMAREQGPTQQSVPVSPPSEREEVLP